MFNGNSGYSLADVAAATGNNGMFGKLFNWTCLPDGTNIFILHFGKDGFSYTGTV